MQKTHDVAISRRLAMIQAPTTLRGAIVPPNLRTRHRRWLASLLLAAAIGHVLLAGREHTSGQTDAAIEALYEVARGEGEVVLWGPQDRELDWIPAEFGKRFPGIRVTWSADRSANTKIITEQRAGRHAVDVLTFSLGGLVPLSERRMLGTNTWSIWKADPQGVLLDGAAATLYNLVYTIVYNEALVKAAELPKTWEDLLAPRWKGKLVASQFLLPRLLGFLALDWGAPKTIAFARALIEQQDMLITRAPREVILQRGERLIGVGEFVSASLYWKKSLGMGIGWAPMPTMAAAQFVVAPLARAPHPNAAKLLAGWLASEEAKSLRERLRYDADVRPGAKTALASELAATRARIIYEDVSNMKARAAHYETMSAIVAGRVR
jgi:iron(III) transport system substrate-binding protein